MCRNDVHLAGHTKRVQRLAAVSHRVPVRTGTHDYSDFRAHCPIVALVLREYHLEGVPAAVVLLGKNLVDSPEYFSFQSRYFVIAPTLQIAIQQRRKLDV